MAEQRYTLQELQLMEIHRLIDDLATPVIEVPKAKPTFISYKLEVKKICIKTEQAITAYTS